MFRRVDAVRMHGSMSHVGRRVKTRIDKQRGSEWDEANAES